MGIKGLTKFIADAAPNAIKEIKIENLMGRIVAIDASMSLYQFIIAIRDSEQYGNLMNESGETTSHISGLMSRSIKLMENGLKPVYVFDGAPPDLKGSELEKRGEKRQKAEELLKKAKEEGNLEEIKKQSGRTVRVTKKQNEEAKKLLTLMGIPVVEAPCEAESQCAFLTKYNMAHATATEDADALVFGTKILIRNLNANASSNQNKNTSKNTSKRGYILTEINLEQVLKGLNLTMNQFIDFCILCGCDYCDTIKGIGSKTAYNLIKEFSCIENIINNIDKNKYQVPLNFKYVEARNSFINPKVLKKEDIKIDWNEPNIEELKNFLIKDYNFNEIRVTNYINRLLKARKVTTQRRLDNFFTACTKKSTKLVIEESLKEEKPKRKGKKREYPVKDNSTKLNTKQKTGYDIKDVNKETQQKGVIKKEEVDVSVKVNVGVGSHGVENNDVEKNDVENNDVEKNEVENNDVEKNDMEKNDMEKNDVENNDEEGDKPITNFFDEKSDSELGKIKTEKMEQNIRIGSAGSSEVSNTTVMSSSNDVGNAAATGSCNGVGSIASTGGNHSFLSVDPSYMNSVPLKSADKKCAEIKKKNNLFLLPFCPKNVTKVKKRKSIQKC
ncbi:flap endonuclease 1, putative [Plasmodium ovale]|uniref:Flap endonuclease 1 n=2 Tax=Plasmodium ovale TaxID=36330 RepID=A0A1A8VIF5_PLAOA|nr:flap endonuclease 1, putative (FEN1) [Plasmodium ovale curtisi]SCA48380.1 flap endonuclease 1, putative [Plasmodium ovale]